MKNFEERYNDLKSDIIAAIEEESLPLMEDGIAEIEGGRYNSEAWEEMESAHTLYSLGESTPVLILEGDRQMEVMLCDRKTYTTWVHNINLLSCEDLLSLLEWVRFANSCE